MGSFANLAINKFRILSSKNHYSEWFFKKEDRKISPGKLSDVYDLSDDDDDLDTVRYLYVVPCAVMKRRLELAGFDLRTAENEFHDCIKARLLALEEFGYDAQFNYLHHVPEFKAAQFSTWLEKLEVFIKEGLSKAYDFREPKVHADPIVEILLNIPLYQYYEDADVMWDFDTVNWPAKNLETLARAILEVTPPDAVCTLDITDLVTGGFTDAFDDLDEFQSTCTKSKLLFDSAVEEIRGLMKIDDQNEALARLLFANVITAMETYFGDTVRKQISKREALLRRFVETSPELKDKKFPLSRVFDQHEAILGQVTEILDRTSFHNIVLVKNIYCSVFAVNLDSLPFDAVEEAVEKRHDIVHRNGFTKNGSRLIITMSDVSSLIACVSDVLEGIDSQIKEGLLD